MDTLLSAACGTYGKPVRPHRFWVVKNEDEKTREKFRWETRIFWCEDAKEKRARGVRCVRTHLPPTGQADGVGSGTREFSSVERQKDESPRAKAARGAPGG
jgi:hypothetical protein